MDTPVPPPRRQPDLEEHPRRKDDPKTLARVDGHLSRLAAIGETVVAVAAGPDPDRPWLLRATVEGCESTYTIDGGVLRVKLARLRRRWTRARGDELRDALLDAVAAALYSDRVATAVDNDPQTLPASLQPKSTNEKLAPRRMSFTEGATKGSPCSAGPPYCCSTYAAMNATCPPCGVSDFCYAKYGPMGKTVRRLNRLAEGWEGWEVTLAEAELIDRQWRDGVPQDGARGGRDLRLHTGGDASCELGARRLALAARRWHARGGGTVWTYTHRWRQTPVSAWRGISVLASVEGASDAREASARGYAVAVTVGPSDVDTPKTVPWEGTDLRVVPCPYDVRKKAAPGDEPLVCSRCRLCLDRDLVDLRLAIAFPAHGAGRKKAPASLPADKLVQVRMRASSDDAPATTERTARTQAPRPSTPAVADDAPPDEPTVDWAAVVDVAEGVASLEDVGAHLLEVAKGITTSAAHMYVIGRHLRAKKKELGHGNYGPWLATQPIGRRTVTKYTGFAGRIDRWTNQNGTLVPVSVLRRLISGDDQDANEHVPADDASRDVAKGLQGMGFTATEARAAAAAAIKAGYTGEEAVVAGLQYTRCGEVPESLSGVVSPVAGEGAAEEAMEVPNGAECVALEALRTLTSTVPHELRESTLTRVFEKASALDGIAWPPSALASALSRIKRELQRVFNDANKRRPVRERVPAFQVVSLGGGFVVISQGDAWKRTCDPRVLYALLGGVASAIVVEGRQMLVATDSGRGTMAAKLREVRAVVERASGDRGEVSPE